MPHRKNRLTPQHAFLLVWMLIAVFSVCYLLDTRCEFLWVVIAQQGNDRFMDFFNHITYVTAYGAKNVYDTSVHACFPPLVYFMYMFFGKILPPDSTVMYSADETAPYALLLYVWYCVLIAGMIACLAGELLKGRFLLAVVGVILTSNIYIFSILERGNSTVIVAVLLLAALLLRNREEWYLREFALFCIAAAAGIKIYPAVFGIFYLYDRRWKEALRLLAYGLLGFFGPFVFFGGFDGLRQFVENQATIQRGGAGAGPACISAFLNYIGQFAGISVSTGTAVICTMLYFGVAVLAAFVADDLWKKTFMLSSIMILCPFWSGRYTRIYMMLPLLFFLAEPHEKTKLQYVYAVMFALLFCFCPVNISHISSIIKVGWPDFVSYSAIYIINILIIWEAVKKMIKMWEVHHERIGN